MPKFIVQHTFAVTLPEPESDEAKMLRDEWETNVPVDDRTGNATQHILNYVILESHVGDHTDKVTWIDSTWQMIDE